MSIVTAVFVPVAANAVIGTIITMIWKPGDGSRVAPIGNIKIGSVGAMVKFGKVSRNVMVPPVLMIFMFVCVMTMCVIKSFISFYFVSIFFHMN